MADTQEVDKQIMALALPNGLTIVTRNTVDFEESSGVSFTNPFST